MVVIVQAAEVRYRTRFKQQSSRTPGTTIVFSKSFYGSFLTRTVSVKSVPRTRTDLSFPEGQAPLVFALISSTVYIVLAALGEPTESSLLTFHNPRLFGPHLHEECESLSAVPADRPLSSTSTVQVLGFALSCLEDFAPER